MSFGSGGAIGEAWYNLTVRDEGVMSGLHDAEQAFARSGLTAERAFDAAGNAIDDTGTRAGTAGGVVTTKLGGAFANLGTLTKGIFANVATGMLQTFGGMAAQAPMMLLSKVGEAVSLARDKAESASKANTIFGDSYHFIEDASKKAADTVNMSSGAYLAAAGDLGNLTTNLGFTGDEAANMSVDMLQLAADMGSFNNASPQEVVEAMGAAFRGETEPIRRFGVMLSEAAVQEKAVQMGLIGTVQEFGNLDFATQQNIKAQATYALILDQTKNAQGDLAKTSGSLANQQARAAAQQEEAWTKIGDKLVPLIQKILPGLQSIILLVVDAFGSLIDVVTDVIDFISPLTDQVVALVKLALGPLKPVTEGAALAISALMVPALAKMVLGFGAATIASVMGLVTTLTGKLIPALKLTSIELENGGANADDFGSKTSGLASMLGGVAVGLYAVNEGLNKSNESMDKFNEKVKTLTPEARAAAAETEVLGFKLGDIANGFAEFVGVAVPWHDLADNAREGADALNGVSKATTATGEATGPAREQMNSYMDFLASRSKIVADQLEADAQRNADALAAAMLPNPERLAEDARETMRFMGQAMERQGLEDAKLLGEGVIGQLGDAMYDEATRTIPAIEHIRDMLKNGLTPEEIAMKAIGQKYVKDVGRGMQSEIPGLKETSQQTAAAAIASISEAGLTGVKGQKGLKAIGIYYDQLLASGLTAAEARVLLAANNVADATIDGLESQTGKADNAANAYVTAFTSALSSKQNDAKVRQAIWSTFGSQMISKSPPARGPLREAILSAGKLASLYVERFNSGLGGLSLGMVGRLDSSREIRAVVRHEIDLRNAPPGVTNAGVAEYVLRGTDATGLSFNLRHAATLRYREAGG